LTWRDNDVTPRLMNQIHAELI